MLLSRHYFWVPTFIFWDYIQLLQAAQLICYKVSLDNSKNISLDDASVLLQSDCYDPTLKTVIYAFGYKCKVNGPATTTLLNAYLNLNDPMNVVLLDWEEEADDAGLGIALGYALHAVPNVFVVGTKLGNTLLNLSNNGLNISKVLLIGFSLGAHLVGYAGRLIRGKGKTITRITGLDPARPLYEGIGQAYQGLDRSCAEQVVVLHTNPGGYGSDISRGSVDIWPNYNVNGLQPGDYPQFSIEDLCSHDRCWKYYSEALLNISIFAASGATNYGTWLTQGQNGNTQIIYLGEDIDKSASGNFYLKTNSKSPFGKGIEGAYSQDSS